MRKLNLEHVRPIQVEELDPISFRKYGTYINLLDMEEMANAGIASRFFLPDLVKLDFSPASLPTICMAHVTKRERNIIVNAEIHKYTCEGILPLDADIVIYVGTTNYKEFDYDNIHAYRVPKGTFVKLNSFIMHGTQFPIDADEAHIVIMLPERTFANDCESHMFPEDKYLEVMI